MGFSDTHFDRTAKYSLGVHEETGGYYLSIPVANSRIDYEEYYAVSPAEFERFTADPAAARAFADACRRREHDDRLILKPGRERGEPC